MTVSESILTSVKKSLGISEEYEHYDSDIILCINTALNILYELGLRPEPFVIHDSSETWDDYFKDYKKIEMVKTYIFQKVKLMFDPPQNGQLIEAINRNLDELTYRIYITVDPLQKAFDNDEDHRDIDD